MQKNLTLVLKSSKCLAIFSIVHYCNIRCCKVSKCSGFVRVSSLLSFWIWGHKSHHTKPREMIVDISFSLLRVDHFALAHIFVHIWHNIPLVFISWMTYESINFVKIFNMRKTFCFRLQIQHFLGLHWKISWFSSSFASLNILMYIAQLQHTSWIQESEGDPECIFLTLNTASGQKFPNDRPVMIWFRGNLT